MQLLRLGQIMSSPVGDHTGDNLQSLDKLVGDLISYLLHLINVFS